MSILAKGTILEQTYEIMEEIGSGGGGIVYRARHLRLQTDVVVKKIKEEVKGKVKLRQEADILKNLKHPYLPRVYDFIEAEDDVYTVMDFIHGENLDNAVKKHGKYSQKQVRKWAGQLGEALEYLHSQKPPIIHSDIKPANIMLTQEGDICLIDFNISLAMGGTMESAVGISVGFSPPEQYRDSALYEKVTYNYTKRRYVPVVKSKTDGSLEVIEERRDRILTDIEDDATEIMNERADDTTKVLRAAVADETEILSSKQTVDQRNNISEKMLSEYTQFIGRGIDERSDIYSLGATLYFLLTGTEPAAIFEQSIPIEKTDISVSEGFILILNKMMNPNPEKRYQNGGQFLKAVKNCYKLDHRYISMHRIQLSIQMASFVCLLAGIMFLFAGQYKKHKEQSIAYYGLIQQAVETMNQYEFEDAEELLERAKDIFEVRIDAYEEEVYLLYLSGKYEECISQGEEYISAMPFLVESEEEKEQFSNIYYVVGNAYFEMQDYANAVSFFAHAIEYFSDNGLFYRDYALSLAKTGQIEKAEKALQEGIESGLAQDSIYMAQGEITHVKGMHEKAVEYLKQAIIITEDVQMKKRAVSLCIDAYRTMGDKMVDEEIALLEQYINQFEGSGNLFMRECLAEAYARKANTDKMQERVYYEKALNLFLSIYEEGYITYQLQENIEILYENMQQFDLAEDMLLMMADKYPERYEVYKRLSFLEADRQQEKENADRNYMQMQTYYEQAVQKYAGKEQDMEMDMLAGMIQELKDSGWL